MDVATFYGKNESFIDRMNFLRVSCYNCSILFLITVVYLIAALSAGCSIRCVYHLQKKKNPFEKGVSLIWHWTASDSETPVLGIWEL